jgi:hypothetical protein
VAAAPLEGTIVTRAGVAKISALARALATRVSHPRKKVGLRVLRTTATTWMFEESNDDRDTAQDQAGMGRILR